VIEFARPWLLALAPLALVPLLWRRRRSAERFSSFLVLPGDPLSRVLALAERGLGALAVAATVLSLAEPRTPPRRAERWVYGARIVFVLDQSASMFSPWVGEGRAENPASKLDVAKDAIRAFVRTRPGDQVALLGFGRSSILYAPLTTDDARVVRALGLVNSDLRDTVIDAALLRALELLTAGDGASPASDAVVLLSDGAGRMLAPEEIARRFRDAGVRLYWLVVEGGAGPDPAMAAFVQALAAHGRTFVLGAVNEMDAALREIGRLERRLVRVETWTEGRSWTLTARGTALAALLLLGVFAFGERTGPDRAPRQGAA
jgi:mxaC protein